MIKDKHEKIQYNINREATKVSVLSLGKIDKYEYVTSKVILLSGPNQIMQQANFTYSPTRPAFKKNPKNDQGSRR